MKHGKNFEDDVSEILINNDFANEIINYSDVEDGILIIKQNYLIFKASVIIKVFFYSSTNLKKKIYSKFRTSAPT